MHRDEIRNDIEILAHQRLDERLRVGGALEVPNVVFDLRDLRRLGDLAWVPDGTPVSARVRVAAIRVEPTFDWFNLTNSNQVLAMTTTYGAAWQNVTTILAPRVVKLGLQVNF